MPPLLFLFILLSSPKLSQTCSPSLSPCPPFPSPLPFPFSSSSSQGCGHPDPSFHITCTFSTSLISINNLSFTILSHSLNSSTLHLSYTSTQTNNCSFSTLPKTSINLTNSPFHFSQTSCNHLSVRPCILSQLPNCNLCGWECELLKTPVSLLHGCQPNHQKTCIFDIFSYLNIFLKSGFQVQWDKNDTYFSNCKSCQAQHGVCGYNASDSRKQFLCYHNKFNTNNLGTSSSSSSSSSIHGNRGIILMCTLFISTCALLLVLAATLIYRLRAQKLSQNEEDPSVVFLHRHRSANLLPPVFSYQELETSTNRFDPRRKIGDGGFGSVYLGQLYDGRIVAVKKLHHTPSMGRRAASNKSFCNEILILSSIHHPNLVKLHGYCSDPRGLLLVYDYVANGTLADHLHGSKSKSLFRNHGSLKSLQVRVEVALQTAMALEYLHFSKPAIVHRDITSSNIFIEKDMRIKVGDFGLSRLLTFPDPSSSSTSCGGYVCTGPQGTPGYLDPDYHRSFRLTEKSDVYSFGVVLFELISGKKAVDMNRDKREVALADMLVSKIQVGSLHQVVDPVLILEGDGLRTVDAVAELAFRCVATDKDDRPDAREVVEELKRIRNRTGD